MIMEPVKFAENRVWRVYNGGAGIDALRGIAEGNDGHFPEDWIASCVMANNPQYDAPDQGLSKVVTEHGVMGFREYLEQDPCAAFGEAHCRRFGHVPGFLAKILDSAERLPLQVHPSVPNAKKYFHSDHGKTECWYILGTREVNGVKPCLLLGFNHELDKDVFLKEARQGEFPTAEKMFHRLEVHPGDIFLVPGGTPHAIGSGVTLIEVMEPTDLVVQPEKFCGTQPLSDSERFSGVTPEEAFHAFDFKAETEAEVRARCSPVPEVIDQTDKACLRCMMPQRFAGYFEVQNLRCNGEYRFINREKCCRAGVVTEGHFTLKTDRTVLELPCGTAFFLPYAMTEGVFAGSGSVVFALPPYKE